MFKNPLLRWAILLGYVVLVYSLCLMPSSSVPKNTFLDKIFFDKWVHIMIHFGTWTLVVWKMKGPGTLNQERQKVFMWGLIIVLAVGASIEYLQAQMGRSMDWTDQLANFFGAIIAWRFWLKFEYRWPMYRW